MTPATPFIGNLDNTARRTVGEAWGGRGLRDGRGGLGVAAEKCQWADLPW